MEKRTGFLQKILKRSGQFAGARGNGLLQAWQRVAASSRQRHAVGSRVKLTVSSRTNCQELASKACRELAGKACRELTARGRKPHGPIPAPLLKVASYKYLGTR